jgi:hypothetical protein
MMTVIIACIKTNMTQERRDPTHSNDVGTKEERKHFDEMIRQSMNRIRSCDSGTQVITAPARSSYVEAVVAHPAAPVEQVVEKEKTTSLTSRRGLSQDTAGQLGERNKDDRNPNGRRLRDATPQDKRLRGRGEGRRRKRGDDDHGGDDDVPRRSKDKNEKEVERESRNPEGTTQTGEGVEMTRTHRRTMTQIKEKGIQEETKRETRKTKRNARGAMMTKMTHRQTMNQRMRSTCLLDGTDDGGLHAARNQEIPTRPAPAICGGKHSAISYKCLQYPNPHMHQVIFFSTSKAVSCWHLAVTTEEYDG